MTERELYRMRAGLRSRLGKLLPLGLILPRAFFGIGLALASCLFSLQANALSCSPFSTYQVKDNVVYYHTNGGQRQLKGIDAATFRPLIPQRHMGSCRAGYAMDAHTVIYEGDRVAEAHAQTFQTIGSGYAKDRRHVYFEWTVVSETPERFKVFDNGYATDGDKIFCGARRLPGKNFIALGYAYAKSESAVFHKCEVLGALDPATFTVFENHPSYGRDHKVVVFDGKLIPGADPGSFEVFVPNAAHARDLRSVYLRDKVISRADPKSMLQIHGYYFRDARAVYLEGQEIVGADPRTFQLTHLGRYAVDRDRVYRDRDVLSGYDRATFEELQYPYTKDKNGIYYLDRLMSMADPATFVAQSQSNASDKNYVYYGEQPVKCVSDQAKREGKYCN